MSSPVRPYWGVKSSIHVFKRVFSLIFRDSWIYFRCHSVLKYLNLNLCIGRNFVYILLLGTQILFNNIIKRKGERGKNNKKGKDWGRTRGRKKGTVWGEEMNGSCNLNMLASCNEYLLRVLSICLIFSYIIISCAFIFSSIWESTLTQ